LTFVICFKIQFVVKINTKRRFYLRSKASLEIHQMFISKSNSCIVIITIFLPLRVFYASYPHRCCHGERIGIEWGRS